MQTGLTSGEASKKLLEYGPNRIFRPTGISFWGIFRHEVTEPMILLLIFVGIIYSIWGDLGEALTIFSVISLLVLAEVNNEFQAKKAISSLQVIAAPKTRVIRDQMMTEIVSEEVVPGDVLILIGGTRVAADAKVIRSIGLQADESALTGESFPQDKNLESAVFAGTIIVAGEGEAQVVTTGAHTRMGEIAATLAEVRPPRTALQLAMRSLSGKLVYLAAFFSFLIPFIGFLRGQDLRIMILTGLSLAFATIPEELPIIITMVLGLGSYTLSKNKFLVKKLKAAETLGNATVIVTDKTGTITEGKLSIASVFPAGNDKKIFETAGGALSEYALNPLETEIKKKLYDSPPAGDALRERNIGDGKKTRSVIRRTSGGCTLYMSGAPEEVFICCSSVSADIRGDLANEASKGRRVIAVARKEMGPCQDKYSFDQIEGGMQFIGLISFEDRTRKGVSETIAQAKRAGIRTIMVTGDHPLTAAYIARESGIMSGDKVMTGNDIDSMSDTVLGEAVKATSVFARTTPQHKYRIVQALQKNGEVVAVTGDGINDALALKAADIGIAMGIKGTDVAKDAAEIVLADDNYVTIAQGIFEGRKFFDNLKKGLKYYLSVKTGLIMIFLLPALFGIPMPFAPIQIILLELFMDLVASAGFVTEPKEKNIYLRKPRDPKENLFNNAAIIDVITKGSVLFVAVTSVYFWGMSRHLPFVTLQTWAFSAWILGHVVLAFVSRSDEESVLSLGLFTNTIINLWAIGAALFLAIAIYVPFIGRRLHVTTVPLGQLVVIGLVVFLIICLLEVRKKLFRRA